MLTRDQATKPRQQRIALQHLPKREARSSSLPRTARQYIIDTQWTFNHVSSRFALTAGW